MEGDDHQPSHRHGFLSGKTLDAKYGYRRNRLLIHMPRERSLETITEESFYNTDKAGKTLHAGVKKGSRYGGTGIEVNVFIYCGAMVFGEGFSR